MIYIPRLRHNFALKAVKVCLYPAFHHFLKTVREVHIKKGLLFISILLFLASGVAFAFAFERFSTASGNLQRAEEGLKKVKAANDMHDMKTAASERDWVKLELEGAREIKQKGMLGAGGGAILLIASVLLFLKSRRPKMAI